MTAALSAKALRIDGRLRPTDLVIEAGELVAVVGPNGGGKTSLLRAIAAVDGRADALDIAGEPIGTVPPARRPRLLSFLPASREVAWPISVRDIVALGLTRLNPARIDELLGALNLHELADRPLTSLSTGERSRALLARALAPRPKLMLLDEPLSNLDPFWVLTVLDLLGAYVEDGGSAVVALHDLHQLARFDRALLVDDGRVRYDGPADDLLNRPEFQDSFGVQFGPGGLTLMPRADRQSSQ